MKTNLSNLMSIISDSESRLTNLTYYIKDNCLTTSTIELDGTTTITENTKEDFLEQLEEINTLIKNISHLKAVLYEKNNSLHLPDGRSIQQAISDNNNLRKLKNIYEDLLSQKSSKRRITEVNNSYFECKTINYDKNNLQSEYNTLVSNIQNTDFEISKLNSIEFDFSL